MSFMMVFTQKEINLKEEVYLRPLPGRYFRIFEHRYLYGIYYTMYVVLLSNYCTNEYRTYIVKILWTKNYLTLWRTKNLWQWTFNERDYTAYPIEDISFTIDQWLIQQWFSNFSIWDQLNFRAFEVQSKLPWYFVPRYQGKIWK